MSVQVEDSEEAYKAASFDDGTVVEAEEFVLDNTVDDYNSSPNNYNVAVGGNAVPVGIAGTDLDWVDGASVGMNDLVAWVGQLGVATTYPAVVAKRSSYFGYPDAGEEGRVQLVVANEDTDSLTAFVGDLVVAIAFDDDNDTATLVAENVDIGIDQQKVGEDVASFPFGFPGSQA